MLGHRLRAGVTVVRDYGADVPPIDGIRRRAQPGLDQPHRQRRRRDGRRRHAHASRRAGDGDAVVVEVGDTGPGMPPEVQRARSSRSTRPRTSARAPASASTSPAASSSSATAARSTIESRPGDTACGSGCPSTAPTRRRPDDVVRAADTPSPGHYGSMPSARLRRSRAVTSRSPAAGAPLLEVRSLGAQRRVVASNRGRTFVVLVDVEDMVVTSPGASRSSWPGFFVFPAPPGKRRGAKGTRCQRSQGGVELNVEKSRAAEARRRTGEPPALAGTVSPGRGRAERGSGPAARRAARHGYEARTGRPRRRGRPAQ